ncbi:MAG: hypothetical protein WCX17_03020 [Parcubacteria group bacterium]|jgi:hypothetical protein
MQFKIPKNTEKYEWTKHSLMKMQHYGLTAQRVLRVINNPQRVEEGVVEKTIAVMQPTSVSTKDGKRVWSSEIWAMYRLQGGTNSKFQIPNFKQITKPKIQNLKPLFTKKLKIISAWRYPGVSPKNNPIPEDIIREIEDLV